MNLDELTSTSGEWLRGAGPESDIVMCSRIRLARNLNDFPFINRASRSEKAEIEAHVRGAIQAVNENLTYFELNQRSKLDLQFLVERQLISRELAGADYPRGVAIGPHENISIMVNEEDHLRIQAMHSGLSLHDVWERINALDDQLEERLPYAFSSQLGYLTACPTNVGTGIRVGVMLHLPALVQTKQIDKVFRALQKINLAVRGLYGEGTQASGDFYQISNQQTLGKSELELIRNLTEVVPQIIEYERTARQKTGERASSAPARPGQPRLWRAQDSTHDLVRGDHAAAFERADGDQSWSDRRSGNSDRQRALYPHPAGALAEDSGLPARSRRAEYRPRLIPPPPALERTTYRSQLSSMTLLRAYSDRRGSPSVVGLAVSHSEPQTALAC